MMSEAPEMNLVMECTTTSAPHFAGEMIIGLNVLSTTNVRPCSHMHIVTGFKMQPQVGRECMVMRCGLTLACAMSARAGRSAMTRVGLEIASANITCQIYRQLLSVINNMERLRKCR